MNGLLNGFVDLITEILADFGDVATLLEGLNHFQTLYNWILVIQIGVVKPLALELLVLLMLLELIKVSLRQAENCTNGFIGIGGLFGIGVKYGVAYAVVNNTGVIMKGIYDLSSDVVQGIMNVSAGMSGTTSINFTYDFSSIISNLQVSGTALGGTLFLALLAMLVAFLATLVVKVIVLGRFVQLYLFVALAPLPLATITVDGHWNMGVGFIKSWIALCFESSGIVLVLSSFPYLINSLTGGSTSVYEGVATIAAVCVTLVFLLMKIGPMTRQVFTGG